MSQRFLSSLNYKALLSVIVPALLIVSLSVYVLGFRAKPSEEAKDSLNNRPFQGRLS